MKRPWLPVLAALLAATILTVHAQSGRAPAAARKPFTVVEATIPEMREALAARRVTSRELVRQYLTRIATHEDKLHAALAVNPRALDEADVLDRERARGRLRGPLHGIPIALKDNIQTTDMPTTGGALAFDGLIPPYEATLTVNLRASGAIIIAKTAMTELANWVAGPPTPMPANYSALGGFTYNPYDPRRDPRDATFDGRPALTTGGSSSGVGTTASFWAANIGTETSGSILNPASQTMLVGIKPTVGRISRHGVIPITADQDTPGPMARTVTDAAILLGVLEGGAPDPNDPATGRCTYPPARDYTRFLNRNGLRGARIGIPRAFFGRPAGGVPTGQQRVMDEAVAVVRQQGAVVIDPADIPSTIDPDPRNNFLLWGICAGATEGKGRDENCSSVLKYGMKRDFNAWLRSLGTAAPVKTLTDLREWNVAHQRAGALKYGQAALDISDEMNLESDRARYEADRARDIWLGATHGIDEVLTAQRLDALMFPGSSGAAIAARPGYPTVIVPFGMVANAPTPPFPPGFDAKASPLGISFAGTACSEPRLIELAYAFEQATARRVPPP
ncbi:MAG: amidase family protein [Vicinamibacterales bacterium]